MASWFMFCLYAFFDASFVFKSRGRNRENEGLFFFFFRQRHRLFLLSLSLAALLVFFFSRQLHSPSRRRLPVAPAAGDRRLLQTGPHSS